MEQRRWIPVSGLVFTGDLCFGIRLEILVYLLLRQSSRLSKEGQGRDLGKKTGECLYPLGIKEERGSQASF